MKKKYMDSIISWKISRSHLLRSAQILTPGGDIVAVILLDVRNLFDCSLSIDQAARVFACSLLNSSIRIHSLTQNFSADQLSFLNLFVEFTKSITTGSKVKSSDEPPFEELVLLVNDWRDTEHLDFGLQKLPQK